MSIESAARGPSGAYPGSARSSRRRCRPPAPGGRAASREVRTAPSKDSAASSSPDSTSGSTPSRARTPVDEDVGVGGVAGRRGRAEPDRVARRAAAISAAYSSIAANARSSASSASRPVRSTSWPSRTIAHLADRAPSGRSPISSLIVLVPQSMAATVMRHGARDLDARGPDGPPVAEQVEHLVAERVDAAALGQRLAGQHVQALHPVGHPAGGDALDLGHALPDLAGELGARSEVALVRRGVRRGQLGVGGEPVLHLLHQPGALEGADPRRGPRAGQVEGRRERRAVRQPRLGGDHVGVAARAAVPDLVDGARRPAELGRDQRPRPRAVDVGRLTRRSSRRTRRSRRLVAWPASAGCPASSHRVPRVVPPRGGCRGAQDLGGVGRGWPRARAACRPRRARGSRLARHHVAEACAGLRLDVGGVVPALLLALELVDARLALRRSAP